MGPGPELRYTPEIRILVAKIGLTKGLYETDELAGLTLTAIDGRGNDLREQMQSGASALFTESDVDIACQYNIVPKWSIDILKGIVGKSFNGTVIVSPINEK